MSEAQNLKNHIRRDPRFHFSLIPILITNIIIAIIWLVRKFDFQHIWFLVLSVVALLAAFTMRIYAVRVQDRVIRLEERLRLQALAPQEWHAQLSKLTEDQLIGLRFASNDEVVDLAKQTLEHNLTRKQIKERIKSWRADNWRI